MVPYYEGFGFVNKGPSKATFGGGKWVDMVSIPGLQEMFKCTADILGRCVILNLLSREQPMVERRLSRSVRKFSTAIPKSNSIMS